MKEVQHDQLQIGVKYCDTSRKEKALIMEFKGFSNGGMAKFLEISENHNHIYTKNNSDGLIHFPQL